MILYQKVTIWQALEVAKESEAELLQLIKDGKIHSIDDVYNYIHNEDLTFEEIVEGTDEPISVKENGAATLELESSDRKEFIWDNYVGFYNDKQ